MVVSLVDMLSSRDTAIILHYVFVFLLPPYPVFGALYYIDSVSKRKTKCHISARTKCGKGIQMY